MLLSFLNNTIGEEDQPYVKSLSAGSIDANVSQCAFN